MATDLKATTTTPAVSKELAKAILISEVMNSGTNTYARQQNSITAVNRILESLLDEEGRQLIKDTTRGGAESVGLGGGPANNAYFPSFNVRTPIVEVILNGISIYPDKLDIDTGSTIKNAKLNFQNFNLSMPLGGAEKTITGSISFFTKNPEEILAYLGVGDTGASNADDFSTSGLPTMTLKFGWAFSDSNAPNKLAKALSPQLTFVVTNIVMSDPGVGGTTFTLSIQELGTIVLQHSSDDLLFDSDYPQQQLRTILEGLLHVRLFTLDDLLFLGPNNGVWNNVSSESMSTHKSSTYAEIAPLPAVPNIATGGTIPGTGSVIHLPSQHSTIPSTSVFKTSISPNVPQVPLVTPSPTVTLSSKTGSSFLSSLAAVENPFKRGGLLDKKLGLVSTNGESFFGTIGNPGTLDKALGFGKPVVPVSAAPAAAVTNTNPGQTCFLTQPGPPIGVNGRNFFTLCEELASQCRCLWYPHSNAPGDVDLVNNASSGAVSLLTNLQRDLQTVKAFPSDILDANLTKKVMETLNSVPYTPVQPVQSHALTKSAAEAQLNNYLLGVSSRLATRSTLFWVPNVPADWRTSGSAYYATGANQEHTEVPYEDGAFFLLPDILDNYDIFAKDLPVQYGPGASNLPYFYGSGQNVFQVSLGAKNTPKLFGEVIAISVTHSNLVTALAQAANEGLAYAVSGKRLGQLESAQNYTTTGDISKQKALAMTPEQKAAASARANAKGNKIINSANAGQASLISQFKSRRFKHALAIGRGGKLEIFDPDTLSGADRSIGGQDTPKGTSSGPAQSASYKIKSRVATFLRWPTAAKITILGDPNLLRLGPGCFELFSYYPVEHNNGTVTQELNSLVSGIYFVTKIEHILGNDGYTTTLEGTKVVDPMGVPSSITGQIFSKIVQSQPAAPAPIYGGLLPSHGVGVIDSPATASQDNTILKQFQVLDLNALDFTSSILGTQLNTVFDIYKNASTIPK